MKDINRVILKLSGEALAKEKQSGYNDELIADIARQVKDIINQGIDVGVVIGGGNYWRGRSNDNIDRTKADQIGMLATIMNCIYVSEIFRSEGLKTNILTPFECGSMTKLFSKDRANKYFGKGMVFNKYTGARGKSGSNDASAEFMGRLRRVMDDAEVSYQTAELGKVDAGGGGTIAYILANLDMNVIDSGIAVQNMHAPFEVISKADLYETLKGYEAFLKM